MRKIVILLLISLVFTSCGGDDNSNNTTVSVTQENIQGSYNIYFWEFKEIFTQNVNNNPVEITLTSVGDNFNEAQWNFQSDGQVTASGTFRLTSTYQIPNFEDQVEIENINLNEDFEPFPYSVNESQRTINLDGEIHDVTLFDGTDLRIRLEETNETGTFEQEIRMTKN